MCPRATFEANDARQDNPELEAAALERARACHPSAQPSLPPLQLDPPEVWWGAWDW
jgi:hypothetical protein